MSRIVLTKQATPATPASNKAAIYVDTTTRRLAMIDDLGVISFITHDGPQDRSVLVNGGFNVQQRYAPGSVAIGGVSTTTRGGQVADGWAVITSVASNLNWQQVDTSGAADALLESRYYGSIICATAVKKVMLSQWILHSDMAHLRNKQVRLSIKTSQKVGSEGQTFKLGLIQLTAAGTVDTSPAFLSGAWSAAAGTDPAWGTNLSAVTPDSTVTPENGTIVGNFVEFTTTLAWKRISGVWTVPSNCKNLVFVVFSNASSVGTTDNFSFAEAQLTQGEEIIDYVEPPIAETLVRCQRRYCKTFALATTPVQNAGVNTGECKAVAGKAGAVANACIFAWRFPVTMWRTPPTVTLYNPAAANALGRNITGTADLGATALTAQLDSSVMAISTGVAATAVGDQCGIHITADAEIVA